MSDQNHGTPRVFLVRHGETEWSISGRHTGRTDISLTAHGESQVLSTAKLIYGPGRLIDPSCLVKAIVSPRKRAQRTFELLSTIDESAQRPSYEITTASDIREWDYGDYEGCLTAQIKMKRQENGLDKTQSWNIWRDGCEGGESPIQVTARVDRLIEEIVLLQQPAMIGNKKANVLVVAHGHILRAFAKRWLKFELQFPIGFMLEPGGVGVLRSVN